MTKSEIPSDSWKETPKCVFVGFDKNNRMLPSEQISIIHVYVFFERSSSQTSGHLQKFLRKLEKSTAGTCKNWCVFIGWCFS